jgi:hypothetical protein
MAVPFRWGAHPDFNSTSSLSINQSESHYLDSWSFGYSSSNQSMKAEGESWDRVSVFVFPSIQIALLRYNLNTIQFIHLKCTMQRILIYSQICATTRQSILEHFYHFMKNPMPFTCHPHLPSSPTLSNHYSTFYLYSIIILDISYIWNM